MKPMTTRDGDVLQVHYIVIPPMAPVRVLIPWAMLVAAIYGLHRYGYLPWSFLMVAVGVCVAVLLGLFVTQVGRYRLDRRAGVAQFRWLATIGRRPIEYPLYGCEGVSMVKQESLGKDAEKACYPVLIQVAGRAPLEVARPQHHLAAMDVAEAIAQFLQVPLVDHTFGAARAWTPETVGTSFRDMAGHDPQFGVEPTPPPAMRARIHREGPRVIISLRHGLSTAAMAGLLVVIIAAGLWGEHVWSAWRHDTLPLAVSTSVMMVVSAVVGGVAGVGALITGVLLWRTEDALTISPEGVAVVHKTAITRRTHVFAVEALKDIVCCPGKRESWWDHVVTRHKLVFIAPSRSHEFFFPPPVQVAEVEYLHRLIGHAVVHALTH